MANYTQNGINFNNVKDGALTIGSSPIWTGQVGVDEFGGIINAVDIDWNGAAFGATDISIIGATRPDVINTSGDLIRAIAWASQQGSASTQIDVNTLKNMIKTETLNIGVDGNKLKIDYKYDLTGETYYCGVFNVSDIEDIPARDDNNTVTSGFGWYVLNQSNDFTVQFNQDNAISVQENTNYYIVIHSKFKIIGDLGNDVTNVLFISAPGDIAAPSTGYLAYKSNYGEVSKVQGIGVAPKYA